MHGAAAVLCGTLLGEPRKEDVCRLGDVTARQLLRLPRVPSDYRVQDILVLVPMRGVSSRISTSAIRRRACSQCGCIVSPISRFPEIS